MINKVFKITFLFKINILNMPNNFQRENYNVLTNYLINKNVYIIP